MARSYDDLQLAVAFHSHGSRPGVVLADGPLRQLTRRAVDARCMAAEVRSRSSRALFWSPSRVARWVSREGPTSWECGGVELPLAMPGLMLPRASAGR